jgi:membrane protein implicated in regulation of membrane protease activity
VKKLHLILLSLVAAVPGGYLCYLLGTALAAPRTDLWNKPLLGGSVVATGLLVLLLAVVWPLLYAVAFYDDPNKGKKADEEEAAAEGDADVEAAVEKPKTPRGDSFEEEDIDAFEREGIKPGNDDADEFEEVSEGSEFDVDEESIDTAETADFDLGDDEFADLDVEEEEEEEAPKKKAKKKKK